MGEFARVRRAERVAAICLLALMLVPVALLSRRIDRDQRSVVFLRWVDDQAGIERGAWADPDRTETEAALYRAVRRKAVALRPDFEEADVVTRWHILRAGDLPQEQASFEALIDEGEVHLQGVKIDWTASEVSANVGALIIGFRIAVADLMWLQVNAAWENGLINRMLPLMKTVVRLDPQFIDAYTLGAWHLAYNVTAMHSSAVDKSHYINSAIDFLEDGLRNNPRSAPIYEELAYNIYFRKLTDYAEAQAYLEQGVQFEPHEARMERELAIMMERQCLESEALAVLYAFDRKHPTWSAHKDAIARLEEKLAARAMEEAGNLEEALERWKALDTRTMSEPVAPLEVIRLRARIASRDYEAEGNLTEARAVLMRARSSLHERYHKRLDARIRELTQRLEQATEDT